MENTKPSCPMGLQLAIRKNPNGSPSSTGGQAFKLISPVGVGVPFATPLFTLFKKPSFMNHGVDGSSGTMKKQHLEPSQGKLMNTPDDWNKKILMQHRSDKAAPVSGSISDVPSNSDQPRNLTRSKWDRNLNNSNMDPKKLKR